MVLRFAALHREARIGAVVIAGNVVVLQAEDVERQPEAYILRAADAQTGGAKLLGLEEVGGLFHSRWYVGSNVRHGHAMHACDEAEFADMNAQRRVFDLVLKQTSGEIGRGQSVRFGHLADVINSCETAAAAHGLHGYGGLAGDMPRQVPGENPRLDVGGPAGTEVDDDVDSLSLVEGRF